RRDGRLDRRPRLAQVGRPLEADAAGDSRRLVLEAFDARGAEDRAVEHRDRLVLDRTEDAVGQALRRGPRLPAVGRGLQLAPPRAGRRADLIEEHERPVLRLEEDGVPRRQRLAVWLDAVGRLRGRGPLAVDVAAD